MEVMNNMNHLSCIIDCLRNYVYFWRRIEIYFICDAQQAGWICLSELSG